MASNQPRDNQVVNWVFTLHYNGFKDTVPSRGCITYEQHLEFTGRLQQLTERGTIRYHCYGYEEAPTTGQCHLQGYIHLEKRMRLRHLKKLLEQDTLHLEGAYASGERNREYCSKSGRFVEQGEMRSQERYQPRRQEAAASAKELKAKIFRDIRDGTKMADQCVEEHPHPHVHEFCKLFGAHGVPEYACGSQSFPDYLELMSQSTCSDSEYFGSCMEVRLHRQVGSRYFVSASNASKIIFLKDAAIKFLSYTGKNDVGNKLEKDVFGKLHDTQELAALRADGIMYYHVYANLFMLSKSNELDKSALDMNTHYLELKFFLEEVKDDIEVALDKTGQVFVSEKRLYGSDKHCNHRLHKSMCSVVDALFDVPEKEKCFLETLLKSGASNMVEKLTSYGENQLPGGIYWEPQEPVKDALSQLKPSNDICESILGLNDYLMTALPNLDQVSRSTLVQVKKNKTLDWLDTLPQQKQDSIVNLAVKSRKEISDACKQEAKERASRRKQILVQSHTRREALKQKQLAEREELYQHHLIVSSEELHGAIAEIEATNKTQSKKQSEKLHLLKTQINIRKKILNQNIRIPFSQSRRPRPLTVIVEELATFITENTPCTDILQNPESIVGSRVRHLFVIDRQTKWYSGTVISYCASEKTHELAYDGEEDHSFTIPQ